MDLSIISGILGIYVTNCCLPLSDFVFVASDTHVLTHTHTPTSAHLDVYNTNQIECAANL